MKAFLYMLFLVIPLHANANIDWSPQKIISHLEQMNFNYLGKIKLSSFYSTQSCIYRSNDVLLIQNYCSDTRKYPAKSFYVVSPAMGYHYFYEDNQVSNQMREVTINRFPEVVASYWDGVASLSLQEVDDLLQAMYHDFGAACWVTNYSPYQNGPHSSCTKTEISLYPQWKRETEEFVFDVDQWDRGLKTLKFLTSH